MSDSSLSSGESVTHSPSMGKVAAPERERFLALDALRGLAALMVMVYHYTTEYQIKFGHVVEPVLSFPPGRYGVQLFFAISGFVIFLTLTHTRTIWDFAVNRLIRLYPPYWVCIGITCLALALVPMPALEVTMRQVLINLTMLTYWLLTPYVDGVYWTLTVELVFYAWVSALFLLKWLPRVEWCIAFWLGLALVVKWAEPPFLMSPLIRATLLLEHGHFFFAGILLYRMKQESPSILRWLLLGICVVSAWFIRDVPHAVALAVSISLLLGLIHGRLGLLEIGPLLFLGQISYPLYLLHQNIGYTLIARMQANGLTSQCWLLIPMAVSLLLATAVHLIVEKPSRTRLRQLWKNSRLRAWLA